VLREAAVRASIQGVLREAPTSTVKFFHSGCRFKTQPPGKVTQLKTTQKQNPLLDWVIYLRILLPNPASLMVSDLHRKTKYSIAVWSLRNQKAHKGYEQNS
jgi:hypothetical protein